MEGVTGVFGIVAKQLTMGQQKERRKKGSIQAREKGLMVGRERTTKASTLSVASLQKKRQRSLLPSAVTALSPDSSPGCPGRQKQTLMNWWSSFHFIHFARNSLNNNNTYKWLLDVSYTLSHLIFTSYQKVLEGPETCPRSQSGDRQLGVGPHRPSGPVAHRFMEHGTGVILAQFCLCLGSGLAHT